MNYPSLATDHAQRAQQTISKIDQKAAMAARLLKSNPPAAIMMLGELRGMIEGLKTDVRIVANERNAMERVAREALALPPHPADTEMLIPVTNAELSIEAAIAADFAEAEYHMRRDDELEMVKHDSGTMWQ